MAQAVFIIDQQRIQAPAFPRPLAWWRRFVPEWMTVTRGAGTDIAISTTGSKDRCRALERWVTGWAGRLAPDAVTAADTLPAEPDRSWEDGTDLSQCVLAGEDCCSTLHLLQMSIAGVEATRITVCSFHRLRHVRELEDVGLAVEDIKVGDWCALSKSMSGSTHYGPCNGDALYLNEVQMPGPRPVRTTVWLCAWHRNGDPTSRAEIGRRARDIAISMNRGDWVTVLQQALPAQFSSPNATPGGITWQQIVDHARRTNSNKHHLSDNPHQRGWLRMPHDSAMAPAGWYVPAWVCCGCGQAEPTEYMLQINHGCCSRHRGCDRDVSNAHRREQGIEPHEPYVGCWTADLPADQAHTDCNCVAVITALAADQPEPKTGDTVTLPDGHPVLVLDALYEACRGERRADPSPTLVRLDLAERRAHGLPDDAPSSEIRVAEGVDARDHYRWALPYLQAYADQLDPATTTDPVDVAALPFRTAPAPALAGAGAPTEDTGQIHAIIAGALATLDSLDPATTTNPVDVAALPFRTGRAEDTWTERFSAGWSDGEVTVIRDVRAGISGPFGEYPAADLDEAAAVLLANGYALAGPWVKHTNGHFAPLLLAGAR